MVGVDAASLLAGSFAALDAGYHFTTTVTVDGVEALSAEGDRIGTGSRLTLTRDGASVAYLITADGSWTSTGDGTWEPLDTAPATADPIAALRAPNSVAVVTSTPSATTLSVVVPAAALGLADGTGTTQATVTVVINDGTLSDLEYTTTQPGVVAIAHAVISPIADATPITAPV